MMDITEVGHAMVTYSITVLVLYIFVYMYSDTPMMMRKHSDRNVPL